MALLAAFRADLGGSNMGYVVPSSPTINYIRFSPGNIVFNYGSAFQITPSPYYSFQAPSGAQAVHLDAQIWITGGFAVGNQIVAKWIKNFSVDANGFITAGTDVVTGIGAPTYSTTAVMRSSGWDSPSTGDYYGLFVWCDGAAGAGTTVTIDGNAAHTFMSGTVFS